MPDLSLAFYSQEAALGKGLLRMSIKDELLYSREFVAVVGSLVEKLGSLDLIK